MSLSYVEVNGAHLRHNARSLKALTHQGQSVVAVVKANAYGHGLREVVNSIDSEVEAFQVDDIEELRELRSLTKKTALVLGYVPRCELEEALRLNADLGVFDREHLSWVGEVARRSGLTARVHLKIDALLGRLGVLPERASELVEEAQKWPELQIESAYAHFGNIEDTTDLGHATAQAEAFSVAFECLKGAISGLKRHMSATSGLLTMEQLPNRQNALVRLGIGIYGMYPSAALARTHNHLDLKPALRWVSHLSQVKEVPAKYPVGYGLTYITGHPMRIGIVPQGYSDGFDRGLSNSGEVLVGGRRCPVIGRIAMNMFAVDLSCVEATREDEVVLLGDQGEQRITAEDMAASLGTINYEITSRLSALLPRVLL
jgi:alanine racemase